MIDKKKPAVKPQPKPKTVTKDVEPSAEQKQIIQQAQAQPRLKKPVISPINRAHCVKGSFQSKVKQPM
ncbi:hypothetical protein QW180_29620 [Vibrio sinaloensis]|nr:hypothetical protein [Vibrio sinaloensis]